MATAEQTAPTIEDRIATASIEVEAAERAAGEAVLDGGDTEAAGERVTRARAALLSLEAAKTAQAERDKAARAAAVKHTEAVARWRYLARQLAYVERLRPVLVLRTELADLEAKVMSLPEAGEHRIIGHEGLDPNARGDVMRFWFEAEVEAGRLPHVPFVPSPVEDDRFNAHRPAIVKAQSSGLTPADCEQWEKTLKPLVKAAAKAAEPTSKTGDALPWD